MDRAASLAPRAVVVARDAGLEALVWERVLHRLHGLTPFLSDGGPGWALVRDADDDALREVLRSLRAKAGRAYRQRLARLAAVRAAAGYLVEIPLRGTSRFLRGCPVHTLERVGIPTAVVDRLSEFGYRSLGAVASLTRRQLTAQFGVDGEAVFDWVHPPRRESGIGLFQPPPQVEVTSQFDEPVVQRIFVQELLKQVLVPRAVAQLATSTCARHVSVRLETATGPMEGRRILSRASRNVSELGTAVAAVLAGFYTAPREIQEVRLVLGGLGPVAVTQRDLFDRRGPVLAAATAVERKFPARLRRFRHIAAALFPEEQVVDEPFIADGVAA